MECAVVYIMYVNDLKGKFVKTPILMNGNRDSILESEIASAFHIDPLWLIRLDPSISSQRWQLRSIPSTVLVA